MRYAATGQRVVQEQGQSGRPASGTMTSAPTDFNYGICVGKTLNFPIIPLPLALFFGSTWSCNFNRIHSHRLASLCHPAAVATLPPRSISVSFTLRDRFPLDSRKISTNVELRFVRVRRITNKTPVYFFRSSVT